MSLGKLHLVYDIFGWTCYEQHLLVHGHEVKVGFFDIGEKIKYRNMGEYQPPMPEAIIQKKNRLVFYSELDDAIAMSIYPIWVKNKDINNKTFVQELTLPVGEHKKSLADNTEIAAVENFAENNNGALPLLSVKVNPYFFEAQMEDRNINEYSKNDTGIKFNKQTLIYVVLGIIVIIAVYGFMSGGIKL